MDRRTQWWWLRHQRILVQTLQGYNSCKTFEQACNLTWLYRWRGGWTVRFFFWPSLSEEKMRGRHQHEWIEGQQNGSLTSGIDVTDPSTWKYSRMSKKDHKGNWMWDCLIKKNTSQPPLLVDKVNGKITFPSPGLFLCGWIKQTFALLFIMI